jgi:type 1 glutamine amidotransferase
MKALVFYGDYYHPADVVRKGIEPLAGGGFSFDWISDAAGWSPEGLAGCGLVILAKSNYMTADDRNGWMTDAVQAAFAAHVRGGKGLLALHSGIAEYERAAVLRGLLGGVFARHPDACPVTVRPREGHPLAAGSRPFTLTDEHYFLEMDDPQADVFAVTESEHGRQPGAWRRTEGRGRVAVLTPGHPLEVWLHPSYQTLLLNAMRWCAGPA